MINAKSFWCKKTPLRAVIYHFADQLHNRFTQLHVHTTFMRLWNFTLISRFRGTNVRFSFTARSLVASFPVARSHRHDWWTLAVIRLRASTGNNAQERSFAMTENGPSRWHDFMNYAARRTNDDCYDLFRPRGRTLV